MPPAPWPDAEPKRVYLSPPDITEAEIDSVVATLRSGWVAPIGPQVEDFEAEMCAYTGIPHAVALASGTAAIHLGLKALGVRPGDDVIVPTLTFGATAFAVAYVGARPVFLDVEETSWNLDPGLLAAVLGNRREKPPAAIIPVDLFGRTCDYGALLPVAEQYGVPILEDAAEALGAVHHGRPAGSFGRAGVFSFNGNKIMTTGGGGMLVSFDAELVAKARYWANQARELLPWYEHREIGHNYRLSSVLAAIGRAQLARMPAIVARRRAIRQHYTQALADLPGVQVTPQPPWGADNAWLTTVRFDPRFYPQATTRIRLALEAQNIESRPVWKPMHAQPVFTDARRHLTGVADRIFADGLCLPSGTSLSGATIDQVCSIIHVTLGAESG